MTENVVNKDSFEYKAAMFLIEAEALAGLIDGEPRRDLIKFSRLTVEFKQIKDREEKSKFKEEKITPLLDHLQSEAKKDPNISFVIAGIYAYSIDLKFGDIEGSA